MQAHLTVLTTAGYARHEQLLFVILLLCGLGIAIPMARSLTRYLVRRRRTSEEEAARLAARQRAIEDWKSTEQLTTCIADEGYQALMARLEAVLNRLGENRNKGQELTDVPRRKLITVRNEWLATTARRGQWNPYDVNRTQMRYEEIIERLLWMQEQLGEAQTAHARLAEFCEKAESRFSTQPIQLDALRAGIAALAEQVDALTADGFPATSLSGQLPVLRGFVTATANRIAEGDVWEAEKELERTAHNLAKNVAAADAIRQRQAGLEAALPVLELAVADASATAVTAIEQYGQDGRQDMQGQLTTLHTAHNALEAQLWLYETYLAEKNADDAEQAKTMIEALCATIRQTSAALEAGRGSSDG